MAARNSFFFAVDAPHELYVEEHGNPDGVPVVILHGGPGAGMSPAQVATFDPALFRIVIFDQRGAGRSTPNACIERNTTAHIIGDIERLRAHLGIDRWIVAGGSWGSCLSLAYGEAHPDRCLGLRIHGVFTGGADEIAWWFYGVRAIFPDHWEDFAGFIPEGERDDLVGAYYRRLTSGAPALEMAAAMSLRGFSGKTQTFLPDPEHVAKVLEPSAALAVSRLFTHYCANGFFMAPRQLFDNLDRIRHLPCEIVQGRYDTVSPMQTAWALHRAWPEAGFAIVTEANHASNKGPLYAELAAASARLARRLGITQ